MHLLRKISVGNLSGRGSVRRGYVWSGKCPSGMCLVGQVSIGMCLVGEMSVGEVSVGEESIGEMSVGDVSRNCLWEKMPYVIFNLIFSGIWYVSHVICIMTFKWDTMIFTKIPLMFQTTAWHPKFTVTYISSHRRCCNICRWSLFLIKSESLEFSIKSPY